MISNMVLLDSTQLNALTLLGSTTLTFILLNKTFIFILPRILGFFDVQPKQKQSTYHFTWKFSNILISLIHSFVSGLLCVYSVYAYPSLKENIIESFEILPYYSLAFTVGYFLYDLLDIFIHRHGYEKYAEIMIHHFLIITLFGLTIFEKRYVGAMVIGLLSEVHNVFLHNRTLCRMIRVPKSNPAYQAIVHINVMTMFLFRTLPYLFLLCKLTHISLTGSPYVFLPIALLFWTSILLLFIYNTMLLQRFLQMDYFTSQKLSKSVDGDKVTQKID